MVSFMCCECNRTFLATSKKEAEEAYKQFTDMHVFTGDFTPSFKDALDSGEVAYALYCPYCGSTAIEEQ